MDNILNLLKRIKRGVGHPISTATRLRRRLELDRQFNTHIGRGYNGIPKASEVKRRAIKFPKTPEGLLNAPFFCKQHWYYHAELLPGIVAKGIYPSDLPMLPRILLRNCDLENASCLDLGSMEGLIPVLMRRQGAKEVVATDAFDSAGNRMEALKHYYQTEFEFYIVGLMYDLFRKFPGRGFDLINCSGLLYHVYSPLHVLSGLRPLLKRNGLLIVSTNVVDVDGYLMEFNNNGRLQTEQDTFWYLSIKLLDYLLRYLSLAPIDCLYIPHSAVKSNVNYVFDKPSGYLSVVCRAVDQALPLDADRWMKKSESKSIERQGLCDWDLVKKQPPSSIKYRKQVDAAFWRSGIKSIDLWKTVRNTEPLLSAQSTQDSHLLRLTDYS